MCVLIPLMSTSVPVHQGMASYVICPQIKSSQPHSATSWKHINHFFLTRKDTVLQYHFLNPPFPLQTVTHSVLTPWHGRTIIRESMRLNRSHASFTGIHRPKVTPTDQQAERDQGSRTSATDVQKKMTSESISFEHGASWHAEHGVCIF